MDTSHKIWNQTEQKALKLLGGGHSPEVAATACGVTVGRISQLLSEPEFVAEVSELRFQSLNKHNDRDDKYDDMEDRLIDMLKDVLPLMMRPMEILKAISVINKADRRGHSAPQEINQSSTVVQLTMPTLIMQNFTTNINNQVIQAGEQTLETMQSGSLLAAAKLRSTNREVIQNGISESQRAIGIEALTASLPQK